METYSVEEVEYKDGLHLHFVYPADIEGRGKVPLVLFYPGGGWVNVDPKMHYAHCYYLAAAMGVAACAVQYSPLGLAGLERIMSDCIAALDYCKTRHRYHSKFAKICVMGNSAGGQIASSLILCHSDSGTAYVRPDTAIIFAPALDLESIIVNFIRPKKEEEKVQLRAEVKKWNPIEHVKPCPGLSTITILHGTKDSVVDVENTREFVKRCNDAKLPVEYIELEGYGHTDFYVNNPWAKHHQPAQDRANGRSSMKSRDEAFESPDNIFICSVEHMEKHLAQTGFYSGSTHDRKEILQIMTALTKAHFKL